VPGTLPYHAGRVMAAEASGSTRAAVVAAIGYEAILQVGAAALLGVLGIVIAIGVDESSSSVYFIVLAPLVALPVLLQPTVLLLSANFFLRLAKRQVLSPANVLTTAQTAQALLGYAVAYLLNGVAFYLVLSATVETNPNLVLTMGAYSLAGAAGVLVLFVPSGMGVREAVIVAIMSTALPAESVLFAAGLTRAVSVIGDLVPVCAIGSYEAAGRALRFLSRPDSSVTTGPR
jgi:glycosyltransferase 2 family protein